MSDESSSISPFKQLCSATKNTTQPQSLFIKMKNTTASSVTTPSDSGVHASTTTMSTSVSTEKIEGTLHYFHVLVLDPSHSTGYCICKYEVTTPVDISQTDLWELSKYNIMRVVIVEYGLILVDNSSPYEGDWYLDLQAKVEPLISKWKCCHVVVEEYKFPSGRSVKVCGANVNPSYRAAIHMVCRKVKIGYTVVSISAWKNFVAGSSKPTKAQVAFWGKAKAQKNYIQQALLEKWKISFPDWICSPETGKKIQMRSDAVDAVSMGIYFSCIQMRCSASCVSLHPNAGSAIEWNEELKSSMKKKKNTTTAVKAEKKVNIKTAAPLKTAGKPIPVAGDETMFNALGELIPVIKPASKQFDANNLPSSEKDSKGGKKRAVKSAGSVVAAVKPVTTTSNVTKDDTLLQKRKRTESPISQISQSTSSGNIQTLTSQRSFSLPAIVNISPPASKKLKIASKTIEVIDVSD